MGTETREDPGVNALVGGLNKVYSALERPAPKKKGTACGKVCKDVMYQVCADCENPWKSLADCSQWDECLARAVEDGVCQGCEEAPNG
ncbi:MAG TPA: hypothetical protein VM537_12270 [Anaerolineae bacterium]|nr:hypothetical protein [Anaerolineae bacterium]